MGKHDVEEEPQQGAPEWIVTFSDMISLLVTFFVMLMSFSTMEPDEAAIIVGAFGENTGGIIEKGPNSPSEPPQDRREATNPLRGATQPHTRPPEELPENLEEMGQKARANDLEVDFAAVADGLLLTFSQDASFAPGSDVVNRELKKSLIEVGAVLEHYCHLIVIEGFTDEAFVPTPRFPDADSLSAARASAAAQVLLDNSRLARDLVQIAGLGMERPRASNDTAAGRTLNRRIELRILALSKSRERALRDAFQKQQAQEQQR